MHRLLFAVLNRLFTVTTLSGVALMRLISTVTLFFLLALPLTKSASAERLTGSLDIYFIDVEGGAATLLVTPEGESILIDSGNPGLNDRDPKRIARVAIEEAQLKHIDHYVTTHWHRDHYGGILTRTNFIPVKHYWDRGIPEKLEEDADFQERLALYLKVSNGQSKTLVPGDVLPLRASSDPTIPSVIIRVMVSNESFIPSGTKNKTNRFCEKHQAKQPDPSDNAKSLGVLLSFGDFDFLCLGDLTWNVEHDLVCPENRIGEVDLYMVTHHGLSNSNNPVLVHAVKPTVAVACNGPHKGAHPEVINTLRSSDQLEAIYQLHLNLDATIAQNTDKKFIANLMDPCTARYIVTRVHKSSEHYSLQIENSSSSRRFESK